MRRQDGMVALELVAALIFSLSVLTAVVYYGRLIYAYEITQKAATAGARYLSSVAVVNMKNTALASQESSLAQTIAQTELAALGLPTVVVVTCDAVPCAVLGVVPIEVSVTVLVSVPQIFPGYLGDLPEQRLVISRSMRYVGN